MRSDESIREEGEPADDEGNAGGGERLDQSVAVSVGAVEDGDAGVGAGGLAQPLNLAREVRGFGGGGRGPRPGGLFPTRLAGGGGVVWGGGGRRARRPPGGLSRHSLAWAGVSCAGRSAPGRSGR